MNPRDLPPSVYLPIFVITSPPAATAYIDVFARRSSVGCCPSPLVCLMVRVRLNFALFVRSVVIVVLQRVRS